MLGHVVDTTPLSSSIISPGVFRIPNEILLEVFFAYKQRVEEDHRRDHHGWEGLISGTYEWIIVTHVCHHWRTVALNCPSLWTCIYTSAAPQDCIDEILRRSKSLPLSFLSFGSRRPFSHPAMFTNFLGKNGFGRPIHRLQLILNGGFSLPPELHPSSFSPLVLNDLEELSLSGGILIAPERGLVLLDFFASCTFQLKKLSLSCDGWRLSLLHHTLTDLSLHGRIAGAIRRDQFLLALASLTRLKGLHLENILCQFEPSHRTSAVTLALGAHLEFLDLHYDKVLDYDWFLASISFPPTTRLSMSPEDAAMARFNRLLNSLSQTLTRVQATAFKYLGIKLNTQDCGYSRFETLRVALDPSAAPAPNGKTQYDISAELYPELEDGVWTPGTAFHGLLAFLESISTSSIRHLRLHGACTDYIYPKNLVQFFASLESLSILEIVEKISEQSFLQSLNAAIPKCNCINDDAFHHLSSSNNRYCEVCKDFRMSCFARLETLVYVHKDFSSTLDQERIKLLQTFLSYRHMSGHQVTASSARASGLSGWTYRGLVT